MNNILKIALMALMGFLFTGCSATVDLADITLDREAKQFTQPDNDHSGIYVYRDSFAGKALKKSVYINGELLGETADRTYFYKILPLGFHTIETESEFSNNKLDIRTKGGKNYFIRQYIKMGVFVGGAGLEEVDEQEAQKSILKSRLIKTE